MALNNYGLGFQLFADDQASKVFDRVGGKVSGLEKDSAGAAISMQQAQTELAGMGARFTAISQSIAGVLAHATQQAVEFGAAIAEVSTLTNEAAFSTEKMRDLTMRLANQFGADATQQAKALYQTISAGVGDVVGAEALLTNANKLAIGGVTDVTTAVDALTNATNTFASDGLTAAQASDAMFVAIKAGKTTAKELADTLGRVGATAAALKIPFDETAGAVAAITTKGIVTAEAVSGLKAALAGIIKPTSEATAEAQRLGIKFDAASLRAKGLPGFLDSITTSAKFNADSFGKLFGSVEALNAVQALTANGSKTFRDILGSMGGKAGEAEKAFKKMEATSKFQAQLLDGRLKNAYIAIGEAIQPVVDHVKGFISKGVEMFNKLSPGIKRIATYVAAAAAVFTGLIGSALAGAAAVAGLVLAGKALLIGLGAVAAAAAVLAVVFLPLIAAGVTLYVLWTKNVGGLADKVTVWFNKIKLAVTALEQLFTSGGLSESVLKELNTAENSGIKAFAINAFLWFNRIKNFFVGIGDAFSTGMQKVGPIVERISAAIGKLTARFSSTTASAEENKSQFEKWGAIGAKVGDVLVSIVEKVALGIEKAVNFADGVVEVFLKFKPVLSQVWDAAKGLAVAFFGLFSAVAGGTSTTSASADTWNQVGKVLGWVAGTALQTLVVSFRVVAGVLTWVSGLVGGFYALLSGVFTGVVLGVKLIGALFRGDFKGAWDLAGQMVRNWANTILQMFTKVAGGAAGMVDALGKVFGKDLGLKAKVEGLTNPTSATAPAPLPAPAAGSGSANPAAAQAAGAAANAAAVSAAVTSAPASKPVEVTAKTQLVVDGKVLADVVQKHGTQEAFRSGAPTPAPA